MQSKDIKELGIKALKYIIICLLCFAIGLTVGYIWGEYEKDNDTTLFDDNGESVFEVRDDTRILVDEQLDSVGIGIADSLAGNDRSQELVEKINKLELEIDRLNNELEKNYRRAAAIVTESKAALIESGDIHQRITGDLDRAGESIDNSLTIISRIKEYISQGAGIVGSGNHGPAGPD